MNMRSFTIILAASLALNAEARFNREWAASRAVLTPEMYESGEVMHMIMSEKESHWEELAKAGRFDSQQYPNFKIDTSLPCTEGTIDAIEGDSNNTFRCNNIEMYDFKTHAQLGSKQGRGSSSWGWTSETGREFIAIGQMDGAAFAEITPKGKLVYLGRLPAYSTPVIWREIRGFKNYMVIGSEAVNHHVQIFDMRKLLEIDPASPETFSNSDDLTGLFKGLPVGRTHNIVVNEESNMAYAVGAEPRNSTCKSGIIFIDLTDPSKPFSPGCAPQGGYVHDARCQIYRGPDSKYSGREICLGFNENMLTIYDTTDKTKPSIISKTNYTGVSYCHQGWWTDDTKQEYILMDDELDESRKRGPAKDAKPTTYIWDLRSLEKPVQTGLFKGNVVSIDHNQYVYDGYTYQSNYGSGLRVMDIRSIPQDPTGKSVKEVAFFDMYPEDDHLDGGGKAAFVGTWSSFAGFKSGYIYVNSIERGGFVVKLQNKL